MMNKLALFVVSFSAYALVASAQAPVSTGRDQPAPAATEPKASLKLGPGDLVHVSVYDMPELDQRFRVSDQGTASLSLIGELTSSAGRVRRSCVKVTLRNARA
jgi:protein involved in polysaccharide export with SLBB domain